MSAWGGLPDISHLRGMSEPFYFSFDVTKKETVLVCHAVIFASFERLANGDGKIEICTEERDPRMQRFRHFVIDNYGKIAISALQNRILGLAQELEQRQRELVEIKREIKALKEHTK